RGLTAFSVEFAHLQLDGAWVDAVAASLGQDEAEHVFAHAWELGWYRAWGGDGAPAPLVADETHGHDEANACGRHGGFFRDVSHLAQDQVEGNQDAAELLVHGGRRATTILSAGGKQVRLDFVEPRLIHLGKPPALAARLVKALPLLCRCSA